MKNNLLMFIFIVNSLFGYSQSVLPRVGVSEFKSNENEKYVNVISAKVVKVLVDTRRFTVLDLTSQEAVKQEVERQKSEAFLDSKTKVKQDVSMGAEWVVVGNITKLMIYTNKTADGTIQGYKSSIMFTLQVQEVETGKTNQAASFSAITSVWSASAQSAINSAVNLVENDLLTYFIREFPVKSKISKILTTKKDAAMTVLISGGKAFNFKEGDKFNVEKNEIIDGKPYPTQIGEINIIKIAGDDFSECTVLDGGKEILARFNAAEKLICTLILK
jgi:hypothetical protein